MKSLKIIVILCFIGFLIPIIIFASGDGTIDDVYKYAWGENIGWVNFKAAGSNVHVTDSALTGYAWNENYGWIILNPSTGGQSIAYYNVLIFA